MGLTIDRVTASGTPAAREAMAGTVSWVDLTTPDVEAARRFYTGLLGWELTAQRTPMGEHTVASAGGTEVAGMMGQASDAAGTPAEWTVFVVVGDVRASSVRVQDAGGCIREPPFRIPGGAEVAVAADRTGATFAVISGGPTPGPYYSQHLGAVCWAELMTGDVQSAIGFYRDVLGWTAETDAGGPTPYTVCSLGDQPVAGIIGRPEGLSADVPDSWSVYFAVADCGAAERLATQLGGSVVLSATETPMGAFAVLADPAGAAFQVMETSGSSRPNDG